MTRWLYPLVPTVLVTAALSACAPTIQHTAMMPAMFHEATLIREVAVLPFDGREGTEFALEIEGALSGIRVSQRPFFTVLERAKLEKVLSEMKLSQSGLVDEKTGRKYRGKTSLSVAAFSGRAARVFPHRRSGGPA